MHSVLSKYYNYFFLIVIVFYNLFPKKIRPYVLLLSSLLFFYLLSGWRVLFILITIITIYLSTLWMKKIDDKKNIELNSCNVDDKKSIKEKYKRQKRLVLILCLIINVFFFLGY